MTDSPSSTVCHAVVTGASRGLGAAIALRFAADGFRLTLVARDAAALESVASDCREAGAREVSVVAADLLVPADRDRVAAAVADTGLSVLVNNAGLDAYFPFEELTRETIDRVVGLNVTATIDLTRLVVPSLVATAKAEGMGGRIVTISSTAGKFGAPFGAVYGATKAALVGFSRSLDIELAGRGVTSSVVCPGFADEGGIYEVMKARTGRGAPTLVGSTTAEAVAEAVAKTVARPRPERIVNSLPMRLPIVLGEAFPRFGRWLTAKTSARWLRKAAEANAAAANAAARPRDESADASRAA